MMQNEPMVDLRHIVVNLRILPRRIQKRRPAPLSSFLLPTLELRLEHASHAQTRFALRV